MRKNILLIRERKENLNVRSQIDGELGLLDVVLGQSINPGQKIGQINDLSDYKIEAMIDEHYIDRVKPGLSAAFERQGSSFDLTVRKVYPEVRDGKFRTDFVFTGERPDNIRSGQTYYNSNLEAWATYREYHYSEELSSRARAEAGYLFLIRMERKLTGVLSRSAVRTRNIMRFLKVWKPVRR